jgi:ABC-type multidrug transport system fused ATPase/permease subunit
LTRAIWGKRKIVLMDEATSGVDQETEGLLMEVIRREFEGCTVFMVAHRRETVLDCDGVVVLEGGRIVEVGETGILMRTEGSELRKLLGGGDF